MKKTEFLNEENYQQTKKKIVLVSLIVLIVGILLGVSLIVTGIVKQSKLNAEYSDESKASVQAKLNTEKKNLESKIVELENGKTTALESEKQSLESKKAELEAKIKPVEDQIKKLERVQFNGFNDAYYERQDKIEELEKSIASDTKAIKVIDNALDESFNHCMFDEAKNNQYTAKYCSLVNNDNDELKNVSVIKSALDESFDWCKFDEAKNNKYTSTYCSYKLQLEDFNDFNKQMSSSKYIPFYILGAFVIFGSCMIAGAIYMFAKRREMLAFTAQQVMPVAQEGIEKMAPTVGKAGASIAKEMAPAFGGIAKEISKGIKEGISSDETQSEDKTEK